MKKLDFDAIWKGFHLYNFALYDQDRVYFKNEIFPRDNRFLGNTAIEFNGEVIAIWNVSNPQREDAQTLAANLVHEMFHAHQKSLGENRFPNDLIMLDYPNDLENYQIKYRENCVLAQALSCAQNALKKNLLKDFISYRKYRQFTWGDIIRQECLTETIEGTAEYAGLTALKQINEEKYQTQIEKYASFLQGSGKDFFDIRKMSYYSGALFCLLLKEIGANFYHQIGQTELTLFEIISKEIKAEKPLVKENFLKEEFENYKQSKKEKFDGFFKEKRDEITGDFFICGYDPMNMIKSGNMILCSHFIMLQGAQGNEPVFVKGPVLVKLKENSYNKVYSYIK